MFTNSFAICMVLFVYEYGIVYLCGVRENGIHQLFFYIIMNYKKPIYETPDMKVFEMHTEGVMCQSGVVDYGVAGGAGANGSLITIGNGEDY